jgi:hypothetical protein
MKPSAPNTMKKAVVMISDVLELARPSRTSTATQAPPASIPLAPAQVSASRPGLSNADAAT